MFINDLGFYDIVLIFPFAQVFLIHADNLIGIVFFICMIKLFVILFIVIHTGLVMIVNLNKCIQLF